ncbi:MAG: DUF4157 domain-containing protein [Bacteroidota bacterium]
MDLKSHTEQFPTSEQHPLQASPQIVQQKALQALANQSKVVQRQQSFQDMANRAANTGLPLQLKSGIEQLSGQSMDDVKVHYNSSQPKTMNAHAYAQGSNIHLASGQEKQLPHEAWHVVQQKQGRVQPTVQMKTGVQINDDKGLENEADQMGQKALEMGHQTSSSPIAAPDSPRSSTGHIVQRRLVADNQTLIGDVQDTVQAVGLGNFSMLQVLLHIADNLGVQLPTRANAVVVKSHLFHDRALDQEDYDFLKLRADAVKQAHQYARTKHQNRAGHFANKMIGIDRALQASNHDPITLKALVLANHNVRAVPQIINDINANPNLMAFVNVTNPNRALWAQCMQHLGLVGTTNILGRIHYNELVHFGAINAQFGIPFLHTLSTTAGVNNPKLAQIAAQHAFYATYVTSQNNINALAGLLGTHTEADIRASLAAMTMVAAQHRVRDLALILPHAQNAAALQGGLQRAQNHGFSAAKTVAMFANLPPNSNANAINDATDVAQEAHTRGAADAQVEHDQRVANLRAQAETEKQQVDLRNDRAVKSRMKSNLVAHLEAGPHMNKYGKAVKEYNRLLGQTSATEKAAIDTQTTASIDHSNTVTKPNRAAQREAHYTTYLQNTRHDGRSFTVLDFAGGSTAVAQNIMTAVRQFPVLYGLVTNNASSLSLASNCLAQIGAAHTAAIMGMVSVQTMAHFNTYGGLRLLDALRANGGVANVTITGVGNNMNFFRHYDSVNNNCRRDMANLLANHSINNIMNLCNAMTMYQTSARPSEIIALLPHAANTAALLAGLRLARDVEWDSVNVNHYFTNLPNGSNANAVRAAVHNNVLGSINKNTHFAHYINALNVLIEQEGYKIVKSDWTNLGSDTTERTCYIYDSGNNYIHQWFVYHYHPDAQGASVGHGYASKKHIKPIPGNNTTQRRYWSEIPDGVKGYMPKGK